MLVSDMHIRFKIGLDKVDSFAYPNFEPEEIDIFLNKAYERFIKQRANGNNLKGTSFEEDQKRVDDLGDIVKTTNPPLTTTVTSDSNIYTTTLPSDYLQLERTYVTGTGVKCGTTLTTFKIKARPSKNDQIDVQLEDPFNQPSKEDVLFLREGRNLKIYTDGSTAINSATLTYIKYPLTLDINATAIGTPVGFSNQPETAIHTHQEIIDIAVLLALETIESQRYQTNSVEINKQE